MDKAIIICGLGGTGCFIARDFEEKIKFLNNSNQLPQNISVHYYDSEVSPPTGVINNRYRIAVSDQSSAVRTCETFRRDIENFKDAWPLENTSSPCPQKLDYFTGAGLGQLRAKGRLGYLKHLQNEKPTILEDLKNSIQNKREPLNEAGGELYIILVGSVAGGTGSGTFLDLAFMIKDSIDFSHKIFGIFMVGKAAMKDRNTSRQSRIWANANSYAAAMELNYWLREREPFEMNYPNNVSISTSEKPFNMFCIIDNENKGNKVLSSHREYEKLIADSILDIFVREGGGFAGVDDAFGMAAGLDNNFSKFFGSIGRGTIRYPFKDNLAYLGSKLFSEYINKIIVTSETQKINKLLQSSIEDFKLRDDSPTKEGKRFDDLKDALDSGKIKNEFGDEVGIPTFPPVQVLIDEIRRRKRNCYEQTDKVKGIINDKKKEIDSFFSNRKKIVSEQIIKVIHNTIFKRNDDSLIKNEGLSFTHEFSNRLLNFIETKKEIAEKWIKKGLDEKIIEIGSENEEMEQRLKTNISNTNKRRYLDSLRKDFEIYKEYIIWNTKIDILDSLYNQIMKLHNGVDALRKIFKKGLADEMKKEYQRFPSGKSLYPETSLTLKVLSIDKNQQYFDEIFKELVGDTDSKINDFVNKNQSNFMNRILLPLINLSDLNNEEVLISEDDKIDVIDRYQKDRPLTRYEKKSLTKTLRKVGRQFFEEFFLDKLPKNIWHALYTEATLTNTNFSDHVTNYFARIENEATRPFWKGAIPSQTLKFLSGDVGSYEQFKSEHPGEIPDKTEIWADSWPEEREKLPTDEINLTVLEVGSSLIHLNNFDEDGKYYKDYKKYKDKDWLFLDRRYNHQSLPELVKTEMNDEILFLLSEYFGVISETIDKKGNLTGVYKYKNATLENRLRGRENTINWFSKNTKTKEEVLTSLQKEWNSISPNTREDHFKSMQDKLLEKSTDSNISENIRNIYKQNAESIEEAIKRRMYEKKQIVPTSK